MNYNKTKELFIRHKKYVVASSMVAVILAVSVFFFESNDSGDIIAPNSNNKSTSRNYSSKSTQSNQSTNDKNPTDGISEYDYRDAPDHIGERAVVKGRVIKAFTSKGGTTFLDFCQEFSNCPFSAVIFASDLEKFGDVSKYEREVKINGLVKSYNGKAEIILNDPSQIE